MPRYKLPEANKGYDCTAVISLFEEAELGTDAEPTPEGIKKNQHFRFYFDDIKDEQGATYDRGPTEEHIARILALYPGNLPHKDNGRVFVHCYAGISRSSAVTFMLYCKSLGDGMEKAAMALTAESAPYKGIWPSNRIVRIADGILERGGKMIKAVEDWKQEVLDKYDDKGVIIF